MINTLWVEKYRPQTIEECILPESLKKTFKSFIDSKDIPNFLFTGTAGTGKTTVAKALCNEISADYLFINGSDEGRNIDTLRTTIKNFASSISLTSSKKVVILDEADYLNANSTQPALRSFIEEFSSNCRFIFTCNFKNRILEPLQSRCSVIDFKINSTEKPDIAHQFYKRVMFILENEQVEAVPQVVAQLVTRHFPDFRRVLNELQRYSVGGKIDEGILINVSDENYNTLFTNLKQKNFNDVRKWVARNIDSDTTEIFRQIYDKAFQILEPSSIPEIILVLADYQYKAAFVADHEINLMAALTEVMARGKFK